MLSAHRKYTAQANDINNEIIDREMKILHLPLKAKWYEMIESGIKTEEYREIKPYWCNRLLYYITLGIKEYWFVSMKEFKRFLVNMIVFFISLPVVILLILMASWIILFSPISLLVYSNFKPYGWLDKMNDFYHFLKNRL